MKTAEDLSGKKFGNLTVVEFVGRTDRRQSLWKCLCDCGTEKIILAPSLKTGATKSCGCLNIKKIQERRTKHGGKLAGKPTPEYVVWAAMIQRCTNPKIEKYKHYGGRGIKVCDR